MVSLAAKRRGFLDPVSLMSHLRRFSEPSEVAEPIELLRAGMVMHARGLINSRAIQHNMDWIWPYWVERQFDPLDPSFVPRAFSITHINLTHRNWTAIGSPNTFVTPIVDPRGLLTPFYDGWSLDCWVISRKGANLIPSRMAEVEQGLHMQDKFCIRTKSVLDGMSLHVDAELDSEDPSHPICHLSTTAIAHGAALLVVSLRPYNPEGVSLVHRIDLGRDRRSWKVNDKQVVEFCEPVPYHTMSNYKEGDAYFSIHSPNELTTISCEVGLATAAAIFEIHPGEPRRVQLRVDLHRDEIKQDYPRSVASSSPSWTDAMDGVCRATIPNKTFQFLFESHLRALILHSPADVYPGPYTYKRFWFRDAAFMIYAMLKAGMTERARRAVQRFGLRQNAMGYFLSQEGEWDSNGEALWTLRKFCELSGEMPPKEWKPWIRKGADWIIRKRLPSKFNRSASGLLPAGFSAEHLGPNDCYYWDDFWGVAGLHAASHLMRLYGEEKEAIRYSEEAADFMGDVERSLKKAQERLGRVAMPAAPERRMDAGAIGSLVAGYPLQLMRRDDSRLLDTLEYLEQECLVGGCFFHNIIHSGLNPYLTLHMAQVHLRAGDRRYLDRMTCVAAKASPTGQWPEAVHPLTGGGCMGDGQHIWASAEWLLMLMNCFAYEEDKRLVVASGIPQVWLQQDEPLVMGPIQTVFGPVTIRIVPANGQVDVSWEAAWRQAPEVIEIALPGHERYSVSPLDTDRIVLSARN